MIADDLIAAARACLGTPFHHQGRQPGVGLDCGGLMVVALRAIGLDPVDLPAYGRRPRDGMMERMLDAQPLMSRVSIDLLQPGDILLMRFDAEPQHLALLAGDTVIHAYEAVGQVVEHRLDSRWRRRIVRAYRLAEAGR